MINNDLRKRILEKGAEVGCTHFPTAFSCLDVIKYLYDKIITPDDRFILSKGHGEMALFAVLESRGYHPNWTVHLNLNEKEGIYATTGSLGHGLPLGAGRAFAKKIKNEPGNIYVLTGDGEMEEGSNWEALTIADNLKLDNLVLLIDWNKYQATDPIKTVSGNDYLKFTKKLRAFGCNVYLINGHDENEFLELGNLEKGLNAVILDTIKGKGISYLEKNHAHKLDPIKEPNEYKRALEELK
ncbi:MAG: thiamine pyrophosphate-dependent enzyme [Nanoarchaeota archaeon]|nr:thiamine pyrophosphate-dependent enzyme [Nanoarchaeota archaeon]